MLETPTYVFKPKFLYKTLSNIPESKYISLRLLFQDQRLEINLTNEQEQKEKNKKAVTIYEIASIVKV